MSVPAIAAAPVLDGFPLAGVDATSWAILRREMRSVRTTATGNRRESLAFQGPGWPLVKTARRFTLAYQHIGGLRGLVARLLALPGTHTLILWRPEVLAYVGDGERTVFHLPWPPAVDSTAPPGGVSPALFQPEVRVGIADADPLAHQAKTGAEIDALAGAPPPAGEAWFEAGGTRFVVAAPAAGEPLWATVHPLYTVFRGEEGETTLSNPIREPRTLVLLEA